MGRLNKVKLKRRDFLVQSRLILPETCKAADQSLDRIRHPWASVKPDPTVLSGKPEEPDLSTEELFNHVEHLRPDQLEPYGREVSTQKTVSNASLQTGQEPEWEEFAEFDEELYGDFDLMDNVVPLQDSEKNMLLSEEFKTELLSKDDLFESVTVDHACLSTYVPSLGSQVHCLLPLPLPDPFLQGERQCRLDGYISQEHDDNMTEASQNLTEESFTLQDQLHGGFYLESPWIQKEEFATIDGYSSEFCQLVPLVMEDNTNFMTFKTIDEDRSQLEELLVEEELKAPPCQSPALLVGSSLADTLPPEDHSLETPLLPAPLSAKLLTLEDLKPVPLRTYTEFESLSRCSPHQLMQSDIHFDLCCVEKCRFTEPEMNKVAFPHLEKMQREWREVAGLKWNVWKVELNLSWLLHAPPEENVDLNQAVMEYIQNEQKQHGHVDYQETFHKENLELPPLELPEALNQVSGKVKNPEKFSCVQDLFNKSLHTATSTLNQTEPDRRKITDTCTDRITEDQCCIAECKKAITGLQRHTDGKQEPHNHSPSMMTQGETLSIRTQTPKESHSQGTNCVTMGHKRKKLEVQHLEGESHSSSSTVLSPNPTQSLNLPQGLNSPQGGSQSVSNSVFRHNPSQSHGLPWGASQPVSAAVVSPDGMQSLRSLQDPFLDSPVRTTQQSKGILPNHGILNVQKVQRSQDQPQCLETDKSMGGSMEDREGLTRGQAGLGQEQTGTGVNHSHQDGGVGLNGWSDAKYRNINEVIKGKESVTISQRSPNRRQAKSRGKCLTYQQEDEYQQIILLVAQHASYFITSLVNSGDIDKSITFASLTPDLTRFLVKEVTSQPEKLHYEERHRSSLALHTLCCTREMISLVCLESGLELLSLIQEKYKDNLKGCLDTLRQQLLSAKLMCDQKRILHPKIYQLCLAVHKKLTGKDPERQGHTKILVILSKELDSLTRTLKQSLQSLDKVKVHIQLSGNCLNILESLDQCTCMLLHKDLITSEFPWSQFCLVVEYEEDQFMEVCQRQNISYRYFSFSQAPTSYAADSSIPDVNVTIMCSSAVPENFVHILESKCGVTCLYRTCGPGLTLPHVMIDEVTSVLMYNVSAVGTEFSPLLKDLTLLSQQFRDILIVASTQGFVQSQLKLKQHQQKLNFFLSRAISKVPDLQFKVVACDGLQKAAEIIAQVCQLLLSSDDQNWMSASPSQDEEFLTRIPCVNPIFAQKMLQILSLQSIMELHPHQLSRLFPRVPARIIQMFYEDVTKLRTSVSTSQGERLGEIEGFCGSASDSSPSCNHTQNEQSTVCTSQQGLGLRVNYSPSQDTLLNKTSDQNQRNSDCSRTLSQSSASSEFPNEFIRAQTGIEEVNSSYLKELRRIVDRQARNKTDPGTSEDDSQNHSTADFIVPHPHITNNMDEGRYMYINTCNNSGARERLNEYNELFLRKTNRPLSENKNLENVFFPSHDQKSPDKMLTDNMGCVAEDHGIYNKSQSVETSNSSTHGTGLPAKYHQNSTCEVLHTSMECNPLASYADTDASCPTSEDFEDSLISTTRQLLRQASLSSKDSIFHRTGPRKVSIGLARPLPQQKIAVSHHSNGAGLSQTYPGLNPPDLPPHERLRVTTSLSEPSTNLPKTARFSSHQGHEGIGSIRINCGQLPLRELPVGTESTHMRRQGFPSKESRVKRLDSCYTPCQCPHQGNDQDCNSLCRSQRGSPYIRQNCLPEHGDLQNPTEVDPRCVWPGYDSPPMDMEYGMVPLQDFTENLNSSNKSKGSAKKLCYQRVPNSKQSRLVFQ